MVHTDACLTGTVCNGTDFTAPREKLDQLNPKTGTLNDTDNISQDLTFTFTDQHVKPGKGQRSCLYNPQSRKKY